MNNIKDSDIKYKFKYLYKHRRRHSIVTRVLITILWIALALWTMIGILDFIYKLLVEGTIQLMIVLTHHVLINAAFYLWKQILCAVALFYISLGKNVKEKYDTSIIVSKDGFTLFYESVRFDYKKYPEEVTVRERFKFKDIKKVKLIGSKITLISKHHETVYDKDGKVLSKKVKKEGTRKTIYVPKEYITEVYKDIDDGFKKIKKKVKNK